jgi:mRNA-degrading endonuclease RelE of RelBE toxin-antitoxin system
VKDDVKTAIAHLLQSPEAGVLIPGSSDARKFRVRNSDIRKGKSGGYRLIYYWNSRAGETLYLLLLYAKSDKSNVNIAELKTLLKELPQ